MFIGIAVVLLAGVIFLIFFNIRAIRRSQTVSGHKRAERKERDSEAGNHAAPDTPAAAAPPAVANQVRPANKAADLPQQPSDEEYRQALRSFSGREAFAETSKENKGEPAIQSEDDAYREALRALSKRDTNR